MSSRSLFIVFLCIMSSGSLFIVFPCLMSSRSLFIVFLCLISSRYLLIVFLCLMNPNSLVIVMSSLVLYYILGANYEPPLTNVFTMQWFLTLFGTSLPKSTALRVWDSVFLQGSEILLRTALAIWTKIQEYVTETL